MHHFKFVIIIVSICLLASANYAIAEDKLPVNIIFNPTAYTLKKGEFIVPLALGFDYGVSDRQQFGFKVIPFPESILLGYNDRKVKLYSEFNYNILYIKHVLSKNDQSNSATSFLFGVHEFIGSVLTITRANREGSGVLDGHNVKSIFIQLVRSRQLTPKISSHFGVFSDIFTDDPKPAQEFFIGFNNKKSEKINLALEATYRNKEKRLLTGSTATFLVGSHYNLQLGLAYGYKDIYYFPVILVNQWWRF